MKIYDLEKPWKIVSESNQISDYQIFTIGRGKNSYPLYDLPCGFDIETTNDDKTKTAYMYHWQFAIQDIVITGRTWDAFFDLLDFLKLKNMFSKANIMIFVHNLGFEMSFLLPLLENKGILKKVFARGKYQPLEIITTTGYIFRDSCALSGMNLSALAKTYCKTQKLVGDLDYTIQRNSMTPLIDKELQYCINDVVILSEYSKVLHSKYTENKMRVPLTSTGVVRQFLKNQIPSKSKKAVHEEVKKLYPKSVNQYNYTMRWLFRGGFTHAQTAKCGELIKNVKSFDLTSAYPSMMITKKYPMTEYISEHPLLWDKRIRNDDISVIAIYNFKNIRSKGFHVIESKHKCISVKNGLFENGRLAFATDLTVFLTEIDFKIYQMYYKWDSFKVIAMKTAIKKPLPKYLLNTVAEFYKDKKFLKENPLDTDDYKQQYFETKAKLNSCYGMCVSRLNLEEYIFKNGEWIEEQNTNYSDIIKNQVLSPYWGIYVTAYCRYTILSNIYECGENALYSDTDSIKCVGDCSDVFTNYNKINTENTRKICEQNNLDVEIYKDLGNFDYEGEYENFKTWGSKRYVFTKNGKTEAVIAGLPKKTISKYLETHSEKDLYLKFEPEMEFFVSGKNAHQYFGHSITEIDGEQMEEFGGCYIFSVPFTMTVDKLFLTQISERKKLNDK